MNPIDLTMVFLDLVKTLGDGVLLRADEPGPGLVVPERFTMDERP